MECLVVVGTKHNSTVQFDRRRDCDSVVEATNVARQMIDHVTNANQANQHQVYT